jgi:hypothetical protein
MFGIYILSRKINNFILLLYNIVLETIKNKINNQLAFFFVLFIYNVILLYIFLSTEMSIASKMKLFNA